MLVDSDLPPRQVKRLAASAKTRSVSIEVDIADTIELPLEYSRVERVFANLIGNALEVMPDGGRIRISACARDGAAHV